MYKRYTLYTNEKKLYINQFELLISSKNAKFDIISIRNNSFSVSTCKNNLFFVIKQYTIVSHKRFSIRNLRKLNLLKYTKWWKGRIEHTWCFLKYLKNYHFSHSRTVVAYRSDSLVCRRTRMNRRLSDKLHESFTMAAQKWKKEGVIGQIKLWKQNLDNSIVIICFVLFDEKVFGGRHSGPSCWQIIRKVWLGKSNNNVYCSSAAPRDTTRHRYDTTVQSCKSSI